MQNRCILMFFFVWALMFISVLISSVELFLFYNNSGVDLAQKFKKNFRNETKLLSKMAWTSMTVNVDLISYFVWICHSCAAQFWYKTQKVHAIHIVK